MKVVMPGGSGQVGTVLARAFRASGDEVVVLSRVDGGWDGRTLGSWAGLVSGRRARRLSRACGWSCCARRW